MKSILLGALIGALSFVQFAQAAQVSESKFTNESEAGIAVTGGNTRTQAYNLKQNNEYTMSANTVKFAGRYFLTKSGSTETARQWSLGVRYERALSETFSIFVAETLDSNRYAGYLQTYSTDVGAKYWIAKHEDFKWNAEAGYRFTRENASITSTKDKHYARVYTEAEKAWNKSFSNKAWVEYLPNFTRSDDFQVNGEISASAMMSEIFSMKLALLGKFDNALNVGVKERLDTLFTTSLVAKF